VQELHQNSPNDSTPQPSPTPFTSDLDAASDINSAGHLIIASINIISCLSSLQRGQSGQHFKNDDRYGAMDARADATLELRPA
jgi:hypothetical protein